MDFSTTNFIKKEGDYIIDSRDKIFIPFLNTKLKIWIETEENQEWITKQKQNILNSFLNISTDFKEVLCQEIYSIHQQLIFNKRITKSQISLKKILDSM